MPVSDVGSRVGIKLGFAWLQRRLQGRPVGDADGGKKECPSESTLAQASVSSSGLRLAAASAGPSAGASARPSAERYGPSAGPSAGASAGPSAGLLAETSLRSCSCRRCPIRRKR